MVPEAKQAGCYVGLVGKVDGSLTFILSIRRVTL
jgi:hypothetical protein